MSSIHDFAVRLEEANLAAVLELADPDPIALARRRVEQHDVRRVERPFLLDDPARDALLRIRPLMLARDVHVLHDELAVGKHLHHVAASALVLAGDHDDLVALFDTLHALFPPATCPKGLPARAR